MPAVPPPVDLDCPDPPSCPVPAVAPPLRTTTVPAGSSWYRAYDATWGYDEFNPGYGDARFSPVDDPVTGDRLPSMYLAASPTGALLETVFHDVHHQSSRTIYERDLRGKLLAHVRTPARATVFDLRDPELRRLGLHRDAVVATSAEHYPCTRRLAVAALAGTPAKTAQGIIWHSRQAELATVEPVEVLVVFGLPRYHQRRGSWRMFGPGASSLYEGPGRLLVEEIAENLGAIIELDG
jgi:RES domain